MHRQPRTSWLAAFTTAAALLIAPALARAQIAGESVNMVTGTEWPGGDPYLQRQNEPSIAISSANPEHLLAGANDYRTVDIAKAPADKMAGDAWAGIFKSMDGGKTWKSYLMPGYPQDPARYDAAGNLLSRTSTSAPPLMWCGQPTAAIPATYAADGTVKTAAVPATDGTCTSAADPVVRAGPDGMMYFGGIAFQRFTNYGKVYLARFIDLNNKEYGDPTQGTDPVRVVDQKVVAVGGPNDFVDKPWVAVDVPRSWNGTCTVAVRNPDAAGTLSKRSFPGHTVYVAYLRIYADALGRTVSDVMVRHSDDCGATWSTPIKVSDATSVANEGPSLSIDPANGHVYVTWRRVAMAATATTAAQADAIMLSRSFSHANKFTKPRQVAAVAPFDQNTTDTGFRVTLFPTSAISVDRAGARRLHVGWAERVGTAEDSRVVVATKLIAPPPGTLREEDENETNCQKLDRAAAVDGRPITVDATPIPGRGAETFDRGHQFMPSLTFSQGRLVLVYYDSRLDHSRAYYRPNAPFAPDATGSFYEIIRGPLGAPAVTMTNGIPIPTGPDVRLDDFGAIFNRFVDDFGLTQVRHTVDVRVAWALPADAPSFSPQPLSRFPFGERGDEAYLTDPATGNLSLPGYAGDLLVVDKREVKLLQQLKVNPPNLPMFKGGSKPFLGDYIDVQGLAFVKKSGKWAFNTDATAAPVFHAVWTSNEDVVAPPDGRWDLYAPINVNARPSRFDPSVTVNACTPQTAPYAASRNQNVYTSRITDGLVVTSPQNTKPLSSTYVRSFVVAATNATDARKTVKFTFSAPSGTTASWKALSDTALATLASVTADVAPHATVSRTLFVKSATANATLTATVTEVGGLGASASVTLNPPGTTPGLIAPDGSGSVAGAETYTTIQVAANLSNANLSNANLSNANLSNANLSNANLSNANLSNANLSNANLSNAGLANLSNANLSNANLSNANLSNANLSNANLSNANLSNANLSNANLSNSAISDLNYEVQNTGNTTASYTIKVVGTVPTNANGGTDPLQLIVAKTYTTPTAVGCDLKEEAHNHILASIDDVSGSVVPPTGLVSPSVDDPRKEFVTLVLAPGEKAQITLRGKVSLARMAEIGASVQPAPVPQRTPPGGTNGTTTYQQFVARTATTTSVTYDDATGAITAAVRYLPATANLAVPVTTGQVSFFLDGGVFLATVPLDEGGQVTFAPSGLVTGVPVTAFYSGSTAYLPSSGTVTPPGIVVTVNPTAKTLAVNGTWGFSATVTGTTRNGVEWSLSPARCGSTTFDGPWYAAYRAPSYAGTCLLTVTSTTDRSKSATATITVQDAVAAPVTVTVAPSPAATLVGAPLQLSASVANAPTGTGVAWTVVPAGDATVNAEGVFTATWPGSYTVTATAIGTGGVSGSTVVTVSPTTSDPFVIGGAVNDGFVVVRVSRGSPAVPFDGAHVTVAVGDTVTSVPRTALGEYSTTAFAMPAAGSVVTVAVTDGVSTAMGSRPVPVAPVITFPWNGFTFPGGGSLDVTWTVATSPDRFSLDGFCEATTGCVSGTWASMPGGDRGVTVPSARLPTGWPAQLALTAVNDLTFSGNVRAGSSVWVNAKTPATGFLTVNPVDVSTPAQKASTVAAGGNATFFVDPGTSGGWALGKNDGGQLGTGGVVGQVYPVPTAVQNIPSGIASIDAAAWYGVAIDRSGGLWQWGWGESIGVPAGIGGSPTDNPIPIYMGTLSYGPETFQAISAGHNGGLAIRSDGAVFGFGSETAGRIGPSQGNGAIRHVPVLQGAVAVAAGEQHTLALMPDGTVRAMGDNQFGQLGDGTTSPSADGVRVKGLDQVVAIAAGSWHSVALRRDRTVWTWGLNDHGQLGNGSAVPMSPVPVLVSQQSVDAIATGNNHTLAAVEGTLVAWGSNAYGQLGDGSFTDSFTPTGVLGFSGVREFAGGQWHSVARRSDGTIWAWGRNLDGQLGTGAVANANSPVPVRISQVAVTVDPPSATVATTGTMQFVAIVTGAADASVTWSASGGTISATGLYTPPATAGTYTVTATSVADIMAVGTAAVTVTAPAASWALLPAKMPTPRYGHALSVSGGTLYAWGGIANLNGGGVYGPVTTLEIYSIAAARWFWNGSGGTALEGAAGLQVGTGLYRLGGSPDGYASSAVNTWQEFNMFDSTYRYPAALPTVARSLAGAGYVNGQFMITGGSGPTGFCLDSAETWTGNLANPWTPVAPMATGRSRHSVAVVGTRLYAIGGQAVTGAVLSSVEVYDSTTGTWSPGPDLPNPTYNSAAAVLNGKIYVMGGYYRNAAYVLDTTAAVPSWVTLPSLPVGVSQAAAIADGGKVYLVGGDDGTQMLGGHVQVLTP